MNDDSEAAAKVVLELARAEAEHAFAVADRLESKARSLMTIGGASFAVAQATAVPLLGGFPSTADSWWTWLVVGGLLTSALFLLGAIGASASVWWARDQAAVSIEMLRKLLGGDIAAGPARVAATHLIEIASQRRDANTSRGDSLRLVFALWGIATCFALAEIVVAALGRIYA
jgi:hypothetical protein